MGHLYVITSPSGKKYVGITSGSVESRRKRHVSRARSGSKKARCPAVQAAIRKYGPESFRIDTVCVADWDYLTEMEARFIKGLGTKAPNGYNLTDGGDGMIGVVRSDEWRRKISKARAGTKLSEAHKKSIGDAHRGRKRPPETGRKISAALLGKTGRKHSEETKKRIGDTLRGRSHPGHSEETKKLIGKAVKRAFAKKRNNAQMG